MVKVSILLLLLASTVALFSALLSLTRVGASDALQQRLRWRMLTSVLLFIFLMLAYALGWIHPHPLGVT